MRNTDTQSNLELDKGLKLETAKEKLKNSYDKAKKIKTNHSIKIINDESETEVLERMITERTTKKKGSSKSNLEKKFKMLKSKNKKQSSDVDAKGNRLK